MPLWPSFHLIKLRPMSGHLVAERHINDIIKHTDSHSGKVIQFLDSAMYSHKSLTKISH